MNRNKRFVDCTVNEFISIAKDLIDHAKKGNYTNLGAVTGRFSHTPEKPEGSSQFVCRTINEKTQTLDTIYNTKDNDAIREAVLGVQSRISNLKENEDGSATWVERT